MRRTSSLFVVLTAIIALAAVGSFCAMGVKRWAGTAGANGGSALSTVAEEDHLVIADRALAELLCARGCDVVCGPKAVVVSCPKETLPIVAECSEAPALIFFGQTLGDEVAILGRLNKLEYLSFRRCSFAERSLSFLEQTDDLTTLMLASSSIGDSDLEELQPSFALDGLDVSYNRELTYKGVQALSHGASLSELNLAYTSVSDLAFVADMVRLKSLDLMGTPIEDDDLKPLVGLPRLNTLNLEDTGITDEAVQWITQMKALRRLEVRYTQLTDEGIKRLKESIPEVVGR